MKNSVGVLTIECVLLGIHKIMYRVMKYLCLFLLPVLICCTTKKLQRSPASQWADNLLQAQTDSLFYIYGLDSVNNWYLIYAKKRDTLYEIISPKEPCAEAPIQINKTYSLTVASVWRNAQIVHGSIPDGFVIFSNGVAVDDSTIIRPDGELITDLHMAMNIKGLCLVKRLRAF
jgi:hypothetical protein